MRLPQLDVLPRTDRRSADPCRPVRLGRTTLRDRRIFLGTDPASGHPRSRRRSQGTSLSADRCSAQRSRRPVRDHAAGSALLAEITDETVDTLTGATGPDINRQNIVELRQLGGAITRKPRDASAFCHRDAPFSLFIAGPAVPGATSVETHAGQVLTALRPWTAPGLLANFAASDDPAEISRCYDNDTLHWLKELGDHYDPAHVLDTGQVARHPMPRPVTA